jgi:hypothetical protein
MGGTHFLGLDLDKKIFFIYSCYLKKEKKISEVAEHFNLKGHCKDLYFKFCFFDKDLQDKNIRQSVETDLMNILKNFGPILNKKIHNFKLNLIPNKINSN